MNQFPTLQPQLKALTENLSGGTIRTQQALLNFLAAVSQTQFALTRGIAEDLTTAFTNREAGTQTVHALLTSFHTRSERAISEFRSLTDELRNIVYETLEKPLEKAAELPKENPAPASKAAKS